MYNMEHIQESLPQFCLSVPFAIKYNVTFYSQFITIKLLQTWAVKEATYTTKGAIHLHPGQQSPWPLAPSSNII